MKFDEKGAREGEGNIKRFDERKREKGINTRFGTRRGCSLRIGEAQHYEITVTTI